MLDQATLGALAGGVIDGVGIGTVALFHVPRGVAAMARKTAASDTCFPVRALTAAAIPLTTLVGVPVAATAGTFYGAYQGFHDAGRDGLGASLSRRVDDVRRFHTAIHTYTG